MDRHRKDHRSTEVQVRPDRKNEQRLVLTERVAGVEHLDDCSKESEVSFGRVSKPNEGKDRKRTDEDGKGDGSSSLRENVGEHLAANEGELGRALMEVGLERGGGERGRRLVATREDQRGFRQR